MNKREKLAHKLGYQCIPIGLILNPQGQVIGAVKRDGYVAFAITIDGKPVEIRAHKLQAYQKFGDEVYEKGVEVRHLNGNKLDFSWENIALGTHSQNMMDKPKEERRRIAKNASSFVKKYDYAQVIAYHNLHGSRSMTMKHFGITSTGTFHYIMKNKGNQNDELRDFSDSYGFECVIDPKWRYPNMFDLRQYWSDDPRGISAKNKWKEITIFKKGYIENFSTH